MLLLVKPTVSAQRPLRPHGMSGSLVSRFGGPKRAQPQVTLALRASPGYARWAMASGSSIAISDRIIHEADGLIVIDKPAGLPSTGTTLEDPHCAQYLLMRAYRRKIWAIHQLDADTTGVNIFVRRKALVSVWAERLKRNARKRYIAVCSGRPNFDARTIAHPLGFVPEHGRRGIKADGQAALSRVRVLARGPDASILSVVIETGRTHQIRIHLAEEGHPLLGETRYVSPACSRHPRQALHALEIRF